MGERPGRPPATSGEPPHTSLKEARARALRLESERLSGRKRNASRPATTDEVIAANLTHLRTEGRAKKTLVKYKGALARLTARMTRRRVTILLDLDLAAMDAYRRERVAAGARPV